MKYAINGRFLTQRVTGVQRFEREIIKALDKRPEANDFCLVVPRDYDKGYKLESIEIVVIGTFKGILWEQVSFLRYLIKNHLIGINLGNVAPLLKPDIVCIHDVKLVINPEWFNWKYVLWSKLNYINALKRGKLVLTVSEFSKSEIERLYPKRNVEISVLDEGWQHINDIEADTDTLERYQLKKSQYYFSLYQSIPNKNFRWVVNAAKNNPEEIFVVSGWNNKKINNSEIDPDEIARISNIKVLGFVTDEEMKCLIKNCKAFLFPSLYEGFGLPPLEALSMKVPVLVMDIPIMHEILGDDVHYIDEKNERITYGKETGSNALSIHSWQHGASLLIEALM